MYTCTYEHSKGGSAFITEARLSLQGFPHFLLRPWFCRSLFSKDEMVTTSVVVEFYMMFCGQLLVIS